MNAKFEKFCEGEGLSLYVYADGEYADETTQAKRIWQATIQSLEVTPELCDIFDDALNSSDSGNGRARLHEALTAVLSALKEQAK